MMSNSYMFRHQGAALREYSRMKEYKSKYGNLGTVSYLLQ
jgi:hypothetical protein